MKKAVTVTETLTGENRGAFSFLRDCEGADLSPDLEAEESLLMKYPKCLGSKTPSSEEGEHIPEKRKLSSCSGAATCSELVKCVFH